jgi:ATP-dependent Clp protease, protease subunit
MIYQLSIGYFCGSPREMQVEAEELFKLCNTIAKIYAQKTGQSRNVI